jgi:CheY-like chemotaxis protein
MADGTLLLVEDHKITGECLAFVLGWAGYHVVGVPDGKVALDYLLNHPPPDLILLDMLMPPPRYDGWRFLARRRLVPALAAIPVVITTGLGIASEEWATSLGACGLLKKPFDPETLLAEVRRCLPAGALRTAITQRTA